MVSGRDLPAAGGAMAGHDPAVSTAANYRRFAGRETIGRAPAYAVLAEAVAADEQILAFLSALPVAKRQPNLLFAAARHLLGTPTDIHALRDLVRDRADELAAVMRAGAPKPTKPPAARRCYPRWSGCPSRWPCSR